ncbi:MAG: hypothetical protein ACE5OZ_18900 [Candidatus Heimdallarchaeota archaeon]
MDKAPLPLFSYTPADDGSFHLTDHWLEASLAHPDWRFQLLLGILQFSKKHIQEIRQIQSDSLVKLEPKVKESELKIFLKAIKHLTLSNPRLRLQDEARRLFMLLHQP